MTNLLEWMRAGKTFIGTPQEFTDALTYANYCHNRQRSPEITPTQWEQVYGPHTAAMEQRFQREAPGSHA